MNNNFLRQIGLSHCLYCHTDHELGSQCLYTGNTATTPCVEKCGKWFKPAKTNNDWENDFVEKGANLEHEKWSGWQEYVFEKCERHYNFEKDKNGELVQIETGGLVIPEWAVKRWTYQIETPYSKLSEQEKESDRKETRSYLPLVRQLLSSERQRIEKEIMQSEGFKQIIETEKMEERQRLREEIEKIDTLPCLCNKNPFDKLCEYNKGFQRALSDILKLLE